MAEKKKLLICSHWMEIGGAERALLGLLYSIDYNKYDVDLFLCRHSGEFMDLIPAAVNLLPEDKNAAAIAIPATQAIANGCIGIVLGRCIGKVFTKHYLKKHASEISNVAIEYSNRFTYPFVKRINSQKIYDLAISFLEPHYICAHKVKAKKKIAWMHTDYSAIEVDIQAGYKIWGKFDHIIAISDDCKQSFLKKFPKLSGRILTIENILHRDLIWKQACEKDVRNEMPGEIVLLSIGRFCTAKNFDNIPEICKLLVNRGIPVKWYIIGYGGDEALIQRRIIETGMQHHVVILGKKINPYPYIAACDLYVQPSRYEGKCVTVREAQLLGKPVVITNYPTASSQLENNVDGVIVPRDNEGCAQGITALLNDPLKMHQLSEACVSRDYYNENEVEKLFYLIG